MRTARTTVAAALALGAGACAGILGIDDRSLDPTLGDGAASSSGASSGASSSGASSSSSGGGPACADPCVMVSALNHPYLMAADDANVYWTEYGDEGSANGSVKSCPTTGCGAGPLVYATLLAGPTGIAVDAQNVYYSTQLSQTVGGAIWSCPIAGCNGNPTKLVDANAPGDVALDETYVYWTDLYDATINRVPKSGGGTAVLWDAGSQTIGMNGGELIAVDSTFAYVTDKNLLLYRVPIAGGQLVSMYTPSGSFVGAAPVAVDPGGVYLGEAGQILKLAQTATSGGTPIASNIASPSGLAVDGPTGTLYYSDWGTGTGTDGTVGKVPLDGGPASVIHSQLKTPETVAVNATYVFWLSNGVMDAAGNVLSGTGAVLRSPK
jgi:hypothetical protein